MLDLLYSVIIYPIVIILEFSFVFAQKIFKETGFSIVFISLAVSVLCLPLYMVAEKWQQIEREIIKKLKPKTDKIKNVFKGDEQYMILSAYYKQNHYHPIYSLRSSFGLLIQVPFFIAAYYYISHLDLIKGVSFTFIKDLGAPDELFSIGNFKINILPVAMTFITCISSFIYTKGLLTRDKIQLYGMAAIFLILLYNSPSALVLYWTMNNVFSLIKNLYIRIQYKYKHYFLLGLFSLSFILLAIFCYIKYSYNIKGLRIAQLSVIIAIIPWVFVIFKNKISSLLNIVEYDNNKTFPVFLSSIILIWFLLGLFIPSQLIASSPQEFSFLDKYNSPLYFLYNTSIKAFGMFIFLPVLIYFLFSNKIKYYMSFLLFTFSIGMLINVFLFSGNYGNISLDFIFSSSIYHSNKEILINLLILILPFLIAFFLFKQKNRNFILIPVFLFIFSITSISCLNIIKINNGYKELGKYYVKEQNEIKNVSPIFSLSKTENNIVIIMLDRCISVFIPYIFEESPELNSIYSGFTYYPNTVSFNGFTLISSPAAFGGYEYSPLEINKKDETPLVKKHNEALLLLPHILTENNFNVTVTDPPYANNNWIGDLSIYDNYPNVKSYITDSNYTDIWLSENELNLPSTSEVVKRNMFLYSLFRALPLFFRQPMYTEGNWFAPFSMHSLRLTLNGYAVLDFLPRLTNITENPEKNALIMVNNTTHKNVFLQAFDYKPSLTITNYGTSRFAKENAYHTTAAAIKRLADWFVYLKNENVYNNTKIILFSDHGPEANYVTKLGLEFNPDQFNAFLMVKDFNSSDEIKTDFTFMSNADIPSITLENIVNNPINPFTGNSISTEMKKEPLYINMYRSTHHTPGNDNQFGVNPEKDYYVHDNIFIKENWKRASEK